MANKFKFRLLNGTDPQAQYDAIGTYDDLTFYLLSTGIGYLGSTPLFGGGAQQTVVMTSGTLEEPVAGKLYVLNNVTYGADTLTGLYFYNGSTMDSYSDELIADYLNDILVTDMTAEGYAGDDDTIATTKAIMDMIGLKLSDSNIVNAAFFRKVESHTLTAEDLVNSAIQLPEGAKEGDVGLLFTADTDDEEGNEQYYFISLVSYLTSTYTCANTNSIKMTLNPEGNVFTADLNVAATEASIVVDENGVSLKKTDIINDGDGTDEGGVAPTQDRLVTEKALVEYIQTSVLVAVNEAITEALEDVVTYTIDSGTVTE
jgi:hypothetical protein